MGDVAMTLSVMTDSSSTDPTVAALTRQYHCAVAQRCNARLTIERARVRIPFATILKIGYFRSLHDASVHSAVNEYPAIDSGGNVRD